MKKVWGVSVRCRLQSLLTVSITTPLFSVFFSLHPLTLAKIVPQKDFLLEQKIGFMAHVSVRLRDMRLTDRS